MRLFHFSDDGAIARFEPRPVRVPSARPRGQDWLNGPLVWAIEEARQGLYLFPRDCPRIVVWPLETTTDAERQAWFPPGGPRAVAYVEKRWFERLAAGRLYRYDLPPQVFEPLHDAGMWISRQVVDPLGVEVLDDLPAALAGAGVELRVVDSLTPLRGLWDTSLHISGVRLRNAEGWA